MTNFVFLFVYLYVFNKFLNVFFLCKTNDFVLGVCPVLCSNHGKYGGGICHCEEGWKGPECDIPKHDCQSPDCSGHGKCVKGSCECVVGWKGILCNEGNIITIVFRW